MNHQLQSYARQQIKDGLSQMPETWQTRFKMMYSPRDISKDIDAVVDAMPSEKLDWAMQQVENSLKKLEAI